MAATATASGPRYAPPDPTLPKPWKGLVDGKTGYLYFWNPETNVTQYERPSSSAAMSKPSVPSSSVQVQQSSQGPQRGRSPDLNDRYDRNANGGSNEGGYRNHQVYARLLCYILALLFDTYLTQHKAHVNFNTLMLYFNMLFYQLVMVWFV